jgi:hypothetical protein
MTSYTTSSFGNTTERFPTTLPSSQFGASTIPAAGAASMALAAVAVADPSGGETSPGYAFAAAQTKALASRSPSPSYLAPAAVGTVPVSPRTIPSPEAPVALGSGMGLLEGDGEKATVKFTFIPSLEDELSIANGEVVEILQEYDDGWALCANARGTQGMVPVECLERNGGGGGGAANGGGGDPFGGNRNSMRDSSLNIIQTTGTRR